MIGILCLYHAMFNYVCYFCSIFALHHFCFCCFHVIIHARTRTHTRTHTHTHAHYDILRLSDIMVILDHGNICVDTIFMILSCIVFQILKK